MTFSYDDPATNRRDALRLLVGDTYASQVLLQNEEYDFLIGVWGDHGDYSVAAYCAETVAAKFAREVDISADSQSLAANALQEKYLRLAERLRSQSDAEFPGMVYVGGLDPYEPAAIGFYPPAFGTQMHDNPQAGQQDYGDAANVWPDDWKERWGWGGNQ